jgi:Tol biopolymer transport system component
MYFNADAGDGYHVWRQRFPDGVPEQLTNGPTEEEGLALAPDGRSLITSVGLSQRSVWIHDERGDRQISLEGYAYWPLLTADGTRILFRVSRGTATQTTPTDLYVADVATGQTRRLFPGQQVTGYDLSPDDRVVASVVQPGGARTIWIAALDARQPPRQVPGAIGESPRFGRRGDVIFVAAEREGLYLVWTREDGSERRTLGEIGSNVGGTVSPDGEWISGISADRGHMVAFSVQGSPPVPIFPYSHSSRLRWSADGSRLYFSIQYGAASAFAAGRTYSLPMDKGGVLPAMPAGGFRTEAEIAALPGIESVPYGDVVLGPSSSVYAFSKITTTRNLYRIPLE